MNLSRWLATAVRLPSGKVLIAGGVSSALDSTELYDPASNSFAASADTATMNQGRYANTITLLPSGKVLIAGGVGNTSYMFSTELYDSNTNSFAAPEDTPIMNDARYEATATLLASGKVLIAGGCCGNSGGNTPIASTELYDPAPTLSRFRAVRRL